MSNLYAGYTLQPCPCGLEPTKLEAFFADGEGPFVGVSGDDCCGEWTIMFFLIGNITINGPAGIEQQVKAWNAAPRSRPSY